MSTLSWDDVGGDVTEVIAAVASCDKPNLRSSKRSKVADKSGNSNDQMELGLDGHQAQVLVQDQADDESSDSGPEVEFVAKTVPAVSFDEIASFAQLSISKAPSDEQLAADVANYDQLLKVVKDKASQEDLERCKNQGLDAPLDDTSVQNGDASKAKKLAARQVQFMHLVFFLGTLTAAPDTAEASEFFSRGQPGCASNVVFKSKHMYQSNYNNTLANYFWSDSYPPSEEVLFTNILLLLGVDSHPDITTRQEAGVMHGTFFGDQTEMVRTSSLASLLAVPAVLSADIPDLTSTVVPSAIGDSINLTNDAARDLAVRSFMRSQSDESREKMLGGEQLAMLTPQDVANKAIYFAAFKHAGPNGSTLKLLNKNLAAYAEYASQYNIFAPPNLIIPALAAEMGRDRRKSSKSFHTTGGGTIESSLHGSFKTGNDHFGMVFDADCAVGRSFMKKRSAGNNTQTFPLQWEYDMETFCNKGDWSMPSPILWYTASAVLQFLTSSRGAEWFQMQPFDGNPELQSKFHAGAAFEAPVNKQGKNNVKCAIPDYGLAGKLTFLPKYMKFMRKFGNVPSVRGGIKHGTLIWSKQLSNNTQYNTLVNGILSVHFPQRIQMGIASHSLHGAFNAVGMALNNSKRVLDAAGRWYPENDMNVTYATVEACIFQFKVRKHMLDAILSFFSKRAQLPSNPSLAFISANSRLQRSKFYGHNAL